MLVPATLFLTGEKEVAVNAAIAVDVETPVKSHHPHRLLFLLIIAGRM